VRRVDDTDALVAVPQSLTDKRAHDLIALVPAGDEGARVVPALQPEPGNVRIVVPTHDMLPCPAYGGLSVRVYSQLKSCSASEVSSMIEGVLRHRTDATIDRQYTDTHGHCYSTS
jgi:hypothetical protein